MGDQTRPNVHTPPPGPRSAALMKRADEILCTSCFLLVRPNAPGCPVEDDACPIFG